MSILDKSDFPKERYLCPEKLIEGNPILEVIVNPQVGNVHIIKMPKEFTTYCNHICTHKNECTQQTQEKILTILNNFSRNKKA
jgi:hypothetical protein